MSRKYVKTIGLIEEWVFWLGLVLLPLVYWPWGEVAFEVPRVWFVMRWVEGLMLLTLVKVIFGYKLNGLKNGLMWGVVGYWLVAWTSGLMGVDWERSISGNYYRADGLVSLSHLVVLAYWVAMNWRKAWGEKLKVFLAVGSGLVALIILAQPLLWRFVRLLEPGWAGGLGGTFGQPIYASGYLLVCWPVVLSWTYKQMEKNWLYLGWSLVVGLALVLTGSIVSWVGLVGVFIAWRLVRLGWSRFSIWAVVIGVVVCGIGYGWMVIKSDNYTPDSRERLVRKLVLAWEEKPVWGWGWANVDRAFEAVVWPMKYDHDIYVDKAHSSVLELVVTTGVMGLGVYLVFVFLVGKVLFGGKGMQVWQLVFLVYLLHSQTNVVGIAEEVVFWLLVGMSMVWEYNE